MEQARLTRVIRQHLLTDRLLGVDFVPVRRSEAPAADAPVQAAHEEPAPQHSGGAPVVAQAAPASAGSLFASVARPSAAALDRQAKLRILQTLDRDHVQGCTRCELCQSRTHTVFGEGDADAQLLFIGEGPGESEDRQGRPFVGRAGELLDKMIVAMGLKREQVYIANIVKCRPPDNRTPLPTEVDACWPHLHKQILTIAPRVIVALGGPASKTLLQTSTGITALRGTWHWFTGLTPEGPAVPVMPTFHPAYLLRSYTLDNRKKVWDDLQKVMGLLKGQVQLAPPVG